MTWQDIPGWFDWVEFYTELVTTQPGGILVEVGNFLGRSLCCLGQLVKDSGKSFHVVGIDVCTGSGIENGWDNHGAAVREGGGTFAGLLHGNIVKCGLQDYITLVAAKSDRAATLFPDKSLTCVFLDARHDYESVKSDIQTWLPKIKPGGIIGGDDIGIPGEVNPVWPGVGKAVTELLPGFSYKPHDAWAYKVKG